MIVSPETCVPFWSGLLNVIRQCGRERGSKSEPVRRCVSRHEGEGQKERQR